MFDNSDDEDGRNEEEDGEDKWRAERHAREKFLEEQAVGVGLFRVSSYLSLSTPPSHWSPASCLRHAQSPAGLFHPNSLHICQQDSTGGYDQ